MCAPPCYRFEEQRADTNGTDPSGGRAKTINLTVGSNKAERQRLSAEAAVAKRAALDAAARTEEYTQQSELLSAEFASVT